MAARFQCDPGLVSALPTVMLSGKALDSVLDDA
jgi:hypothetical protein